MFNPHVYMSIGFYVAQMLVCIAGLAIEVVHYRRSMRALREETRAMVEEWTRQLALIGRSHREGP